jgi:replicative DNA helicase
MFEQVDSEDQLYKKLQQNREEQSRLAAEEKELRRQAKDRGFEFDDVNHTTRQAKSTTQADDLAKRYFERLRDGKTQQLIRQNRALQGVEIGQGLITIIGAPPGFGKTALAMQIVFDALALDSSLTATIANAETTFDGLLRRELSRRSRIKSDDIRFGTLTSLELDEIQAIITAITPTLARIAVVDECNLANVQRLIDEPPGLLIVDYLQKFSPPGSDARAGVGQVMATMRTLAKADWAVVCLSATARQSNGKHDVKELSISSYRDSGEIEFNADSCYLLVDDGPIDQGCDYIRKTTLKHVKNRHGAKVDRQLRFHMPRMSFEAFEPVPQRHDEFAEYEFSDDPFSGGEL